MSPRGRAVAELLRVAFAAIETLAPADVDALVVAIVGHLRQIRPEQVGCVAMIAPAGEVPSRPGSRGGL